MKLSLSLFDVEQNYLKYTFRLLMQRSIHGIWFSIFWLVSHLILEIEQQVPVSVPTMSDNLSPTNDPVEKPGQAFDCRRSFRYYFVSTLLSSSMKWCRSKRKRDEWCRLLTQMCHSLWSYHSLTTFSESPFLFYCRCHRRVNRSQFLEWQRFIVVVQ